jgi:hypothetical protein
MGIDGLLKAKFINEVMRPRQPAKAGLFFMLKLPAAKNKEFTSQGVFWHTRRINLNQWREGKF